MASGGAIGIGAEWREWELGDQILNNSFACTELQAIDIGRTHRNFETAKLVAVAVAEQPVDRHPQCVDLRKGRDRMRKEDLSRKGIEENVNLQNQSRAPSSTGQNGERRERTRSG